MISIDGYVKELKNSGVNAIIKDDAIWQDYTEAFSAMRLPCFHLTPPKINEVEEIFGELNPIVLSYAEEDLQSPNCYLYSSENTAYTIDNLESKGRRDVRRALRSFDFKEIPWDELQLKGYAAYRDTRSRNDLSDYKRLDFQNLIERTETLSANKNLAVISKETGDVAGFLIYNWVGRYIEIFGVFSVNEYLSDCPNNGMFHYMQEKYLTGKKVDIISYGYSSIQNKSSKDGLHKFKLRVGFKATPIRRYFLINPRYRFLNSNLFRSIVVILLKIFPSNRKLNKISGMLKLIN